MITSATTIATTTIATIATIATTTTTTIMTVSLGFRFWGPKMLVYVLFVVMAFYIPNGFFLFYGNVALVFSGFFILIQLVLLVDFAYRWR